MAGFTSTQTDTVIGTLTNGMKIISTLVTVTSVGATTGTPITIKPLVRVIKFIGGVQLNNTPAGLPLFAVDATYPNIINVTPVVRDTRVRLKSFQLEFKNTKPIVDGFA